MKKRLAKKALSKSYYHLWINPHTERTFWVPRNGRCWNIIQRACGYYGHPEWFEQMTKSILNEIGE